MSQAINQNDNFSQLPLRCNRYWCPQCQRHFARLTTEEDQTNCPSCGTVSRHVGPETFSNDSARSLLSSNLQRTSSEQPSETTERNPLVDEIGKRRQPSELSSPQQPEDTHMGDLNPDEGLIRPPLTNSEPHELDLAHPQPADPTPPNPPRHRLVLVHTIFITGPHGGMIIRTTHLLPESESGEQTDPDHHMNIEEPTQAQGNQGTEATQQGNHQGHHSGLLDFISQLNPLRLFRRRSQDMATEDTENEEQEIQTENLDLSLHHSRSEPADHGNFSPHSFIGTRLLLNPLDSLPNGFFGLERLLEELLRSLPDQNGPPPATDEILNRLEEYDYKPREEADICAICHEDFNENEKVTKLPCKHEYHKSCVFKWLKMHNICPICRQSIRDETQNLVE